MVIRTKYSCPRNSWVVIRLTFVPGKDGYSGWSALLAFWNSTLILPGFRCCRILNFTFFSRLIFTTVTPPCAWTSRAVTFGRSFTIFCESNVPLLGGGRAATFGDSETLFSGDGGEGAAAVSFCESFKNLSKKALSIVFPLSDGP